MKIHAVGVLFPVALLLAACGDKPQSAKPQPDENSAAQDAERVKAQRMAERERLLEPLADAARALKIRPGAIDRCVKPEGPIAVEISWDATSFKTEGVHVFLQNPGEEKTLWSTAGAVGSDRTGEWINDGTKVTLVNGADDTVIASLELKDLPCD